MKILIKIQIHNVNYYTHFSLHLYVASCIEKQFEIRLHKHECPSV